MLGNREEEKRNNKGYPDPTAYRALKNLENDDEWRFHCTLNTLFNTCELGDFDIVGRIVLRDRRTGRIWR